MCVCVCGCVAHANLILSCLSTNDPKFQGTGLSSLQPIMNEDETASQICVCKRAQTYNYPCLIKTTDLETN